MISTLQKTALVCVLLLTSGIECSPASAREVALKALGRFDGWRENSLIGYGLVVGLAGSGDSRRSVVTRQTLGNVMARLGITVGDDDISSRNVAVVMVVATLPASANQGDRISVTVSSVGDARSLSGGTLLMTPLLGPDRRTYALAQGPLVTGGYSFEADRSIQQRNYPTTARVEDGATVETSVDADLKVVDGELSFLLSEPNFTTAHRIADALDTELGSGAAWARSADEVRIRYNGGERDLTSFVSLVENLTVEPDRIPRIVINERTGTVVAGGDVTISSVVVSQGDIRVSVEADNYASQPSFVSGFATDVSSLIVSNSELSVDQGDADAVLEFPSSSVADLVQALSSVGVDTRRTISVLQAIKEAGALHAEIVVQ